MKNYQTVTPKSGRGRLQGLLEVVVRSPCWWWWYYFLSHHPSCHKRSVVNTLLLRARNIPSTSKGKREEVQRVKAVLRENNYPSGFIKECERALATKPSQPTTNGYVVLPYVKGVSERIGRVLKQQSLRVSYQPQKTINSLFP